LSEYDRTKQRLDVEAQRKAAIAMQKLDYDLRSQMEQRRQAAAEKEAEKAQMANSIAAGNAYRKLIYDSAYQGMADPNVYLSIWSGVGKQYGIPSTDPPPISPDEIALITKKAQGDKVLADAAALAAKQKAERAEARQNEATWEEGGYKFFRVYNPETGALEVKKAPRRIGGTGGGGSDENLALDADIAIRQYLGKMATNPEDAPAWTKWKKHGIDPDTGERGWVQRFDMTTALQNVGDHLLEIPGMTAKKYQAWIKAQEQQAAQTNTSKASVPPNTQLQPTNAPMPTSKVVISPEDVEYLRQTNPQLIGNGRKANADIMGALEETGINTPDEMREALKALGWSL
jgi:hypothetical protein